MPKSHTYILTNYHNTVLYIGVTGNLHARIIQHRNEAGASFTTAYKVWKLVFYEHHTDMMRAIAREKQLKNWHRPWKINLIETMNPTWEDLFWGIGPES